MIELRNKIIDGGLATQLEAMGHDLNDQLWSAKLLSEQAGDIVKAHRAFLEAGADILITSSYQASVPGFLAKGFSKEESISLIRKTTELAIEARGDSEVLVGMSIGPYGAFLADGSEYTGDYDVTDEELKSFHQERIEVLDKTGGDFFAVETIPLLREALIISEILEEQSNKLYWISFSCKNDSETCGGNLFSDCAKALGKKKNLLAIGVNCTAPQYIIGLIEIAGEVPIVVYPNSGECYDPETKTWSQQGSGDFSSSAREYFRAGALAVGGCCRILPKDIEGVRK